jgi:antitoxin component of MazEF toxin-antitoxin module
MDEIHLGNRKLQLTHGGSYMIVVPPHFVRNQKLAAGSDLSVFYREDELVFKPLKRKENNGG